MTKWTCFKCWKSGELFWTNSKRESILESERQHLTVSPHCYPEIHLTVTTPTVTEASQEAPTDPATLPFDSPVTPVRQQVRASVKEPSGRGRPEGLFTDNISKENQ